MADLVRLCDAPPGVFRFNGSLGFKTEYGTVVGRKDSRDEPHVYEMTSWTDAYCLDSGEYFVGGTKGDRKARENLMVEPVLMSELDEISATDKMMQSILEAVGFASIYDNGAGIYARNVIRSIQSGNYEAFEALLPAHVPRDGHYIVRELDQDISPEGRKVISDAFGTVALIQVVDPEAKPITFTLAEVDALLTAQRKALAVEHGF